MSDTTTPASPATPAVTVVSSAPDMLTLVIVGTLSSLVSAVSLAVLALAIIHFGGFWPTPAHKTTDFVALGKAYAKELGASYAPAWASYATDLDAGKPLKDAATAMNASWTQNRTAVYEKLIAPELNAIVPENTPDAQVTASQRKALAAAARNFAKGLGGD